jgi:hypothetical protein
LVISQWTRAARNGTGTLHYSLSSHYFANFIHLRLLITFRSNIRETILFPLVRQQQQQSLTTTDSRQQLL